MKTIVHTCQQGSFSCDYTQGEAVRVKRAYQPPVVEVLPVRVEKGFWGSGTRTLTVGSEGVADNASIYFGTGAAPDDGMVEGVGFNGAIFF